MNHTISNMRLRICTLFVVVLNILFNNLYQYFPNTRDVKTVTDQFPSPFTPAGYSFSIWGLIYLGFLVYAIYQLLPSQRYRRIYYELALPMMIVNLLSICWLVVYSQGLIGLSVALISGMVLAGAISFIRARHAVNFGHNPWLGVPFSLFFGWITVAAVSNWFVWLSSLQWDGGAINASLWSVILLIALIAAGIVVSLASKDWIYTLVLAWACVALWDVNRVLRPEVGTTAMVAALTLMTWSVIYVVVQLSRRRYFFYPRKTSTR